MVLLSLLSEVPALRFFVDVVLASCAYVAYKQAGFKSVKNLIQETIVHEPPSDNPAVEAPVVHEPQEALDPSKPPDAPVSVNYFPSRECNYKCGFCFHTETSSYILTDEKAREGLRLLKEAGMRKLNIAGGEPFLHRKLLSSLIRYCKEELGVESISIVSNGSKITEKWMRENSQWLDILAISCDSFNARTNVKIGRGDDGKNADRLFEIAELCKTYNVKFKLNTVVNIYNWDEDMTANIEKLAPFRWKVFQCLIVAGKNDDETRKREPKRTGALDGLEAT